MAMENEFRYWQSYQSARRAMSLGKVFNNLAPMLLLLACMLGLFSSAPGSSELGWWFRSLSCLALILFVVGVILEALGRSLQMTTDIAVNGSPTLTDEEKAKIIARSGSV